MLQVTPTFDPPQRVVALLPCPAPPSSALGLPSGGSQSQAINMPQSTLHFALSFVATFRQDVVAPSPLSPLPQTSSSATFDRLRLANGFHFIVIKWPLN